jgi:hypothetical protein
VRDDFQVLIALRLSRLLVERPSVVDYSKHLEQSGSMRVLATTTRVVKPWDHSRPYCQTLGCTLHRFGPAASDSAKNYRKRKAAVDCEILPRSEPYGCPTPPKFPCWSSGAVKSDRIWGIHTVPVLCGHGSVEPRMFVPARHTELQLRRRANAANLSLGMEPGCQRTEFACGFQSACPASRGKARDLCHSVMAKSLR